MLVVLLSQGITEFKEEEEANPASERLQASLQTLSFYQPGGKAAAAAAAVAVAAAETTSLLLTHLLP